MVRLLQRLLPVNACRAPMWSQKAALDGDVCDNDRRATVASRARRSDCSIPSARRGGHADRALNSQAPSCVLHPHPASPTSVRAGVVSIIRSTLVTTLSPAARRRSALAARAQAMEPEAANETVGSVVVETVDRREESSMAVQVSVMLAGIGCVVLYVVVKRWSHRRALAKAQQESEEMQRSPRHFTAEEYAPAALDSDARRRRPTP